MFKNAQDYIQAIKKSIRQNEYFSCYGKDHLPGLMNGTEPIPEAMKVLGKALETGSSDERKRIIDLLFCVARINHPHYELRTPVVIDLLMGPAFAKADTARDWAVEGLVATVTPDTLRLYDKVILKALDADSSTILLAAKAKTPGAKQILMRKGMWKSDNLTDRIARAALGDTKTEDEFLAEAANREKKGETVYLLDVLKQLAQVGTPRCLRAICERMRTPLVTETPLLMTFQKGQTAPERLPVVRRSVRLSVMDALRYAFPDRDELDSNQVRQASDYTRVEQFCTKQFGVSYEGKPVPEFLTEGWY